MARTAKKGFAYYRAETDRFDDPKIKRLRYKYKGVGYAVYQYLLNEIYRWEGSYTSFNSDAIADCAFYWSLEEAEVRSIVDYCAEIELFNILFWKEYGILTSDSIQERYVDMCHAAKRKPAIPENLNLLNETGEDARVPAPAVPAAAVVPVPVKSIPVPPLPKATASVGVVVKETPASGGNTDADLEEALAAARLFAPADILPEKSGILPEESGILPENTPPNKIKEKKTPSSTPSTFVSGEPEVGGKEEDLLLLEDFQYLGLKEEHFKWACVLRTYYPDLPIDHAIGLIKEGIQAGNYRYTVCNCLMPLIETYTRKYNAEIAPQKKQGDYRASLERLGIYSAKRDEILQIAAAMPHVLDTVLREIEKSKGKIRMPYSFIISRLNAAKAA